MKLQDYKKRWEDLTTKKNLKGKEALAAVKQNGYALRYVSEQTEEICLAAVQQNGYALQFVSETIMQSLLEEEIEIDGKKFSKSTIKEALKNYINN
jgi:ABC-type Fe3+ transport system substrate-binding protein